MDEPIGKEAGRETNIGDKNMSLNVSTNTAALRAGAYLSKNNVRFCSDLSIVSLAVKKYPAQLMTLEAWRFQ